MALKRLPQTCLAFRSDTNKLPSQIQIEVKISLQTNIQMDINYI